MEIQKDGSVIVPPGDYILGDPCYVIEGGWSDLLGSCDCFHSPIGTINGGQVVAFGTLHGDGVYSSSANFDFPVDAGLIGLVPARIAECELDAQLSLPVTFESPARCYKDGGRLNFGHISIDTALDEDDA